ncbi:MAG: PP2C family protein-serine/threonine phosphatase, partial [Thermotogota bacterium]
NIQLSALPGPFPERDDFEIYGQMHTAKEVGGDFYDYFMIDDSHLGFLIADVSGKGIPAALFMMISKSIIKTYSINNSNLANILYKANNTLCENNESNMFVTVFMGILDINTGMFSYASAGHNPPIIKRASKSYEWLEAKSDCPLAALDDYEFTVYNTQFNAGDILFLYTDGVTEAVNKREELFSPERLIEYLNTLPEHTKSESIMLLVNHEVEKFAKGAEQADDITMLLFHMKTNE